MLLQFTPSTFQHLLEPSITIQIEPSKLLYNLRPSPPPSPDHPIQETSIEALHNPRNQSAKAIQRSTKKMDSSRLFGVEVPLMSAIQHLLDIPEEAEKAASGPTRTYVRDARAMAATPADVKELPNAYAFVVDMPGVGTGDIKVQVEDERVLVVSGERRREEEAAAKYLRMERRMGKFMRRFLLPDNADVEKVSAVCKDGVLTVTVDKLPPPEPKKPKTIDVKVA